MSRFYFYVKCSIKNYILRNIIGQIKSNTLCVYVRVCVLVCVCVLAVRVRVRARAHVYIYAKYLQPLYNILIAYSRGKIK